MRGAALALVLAASPAWGDVRAAGIRRAVHQLGDARPENMDAAVDAALELEDTAEVPGLDAPLVLALAWAESRFDTRARPLCGVMQVSPKDMDEPRRMCAAWRADVRSGIEVGIRELNKIAREIRRVRGTLHRVLEYRACGGKAFTRRCRKRRWISRVNAIAERLRAPPYRMEEDRGTRSRFSSLSP